MKDGLYQVIYKGICAGFEIKNDKIIKCAPILKNKIQFWKKLARWINNDR